jgi:hypothetical protein
LSRAPKVRFARTVRTGAHVPRGRERPGAREPLIGPFGVATVTASLAFLCAGLAWPQAAGALLRIFVVLLSIGFVLARAYEALLPSSAPDAYSPFDGDAVGHTPATEPQALRSLGHDLSAADSPRRSERTPVPWSVRHTVIEEASRRLAEHHGLSLAERADHDTIRSLVSEPTWLLLSSGADAHPESRGSRARGSAGGPVVPLSRLGTILDEVERL